MLTLVEKEPEIETGATALQLIEELRTLVQNGYGQNTVWLATEASELRRFACVFTRSMAAKMLELAPAPSAKRDVRNITVVGMLDQLQNALIKQNFHLGMYVHDDTGQYIDGRFGWMPVTFVELLGRSVILHSKVTENQVEEFEDD